MIGGIATILIMVAGFLLLISVALPTDGGQRVRSRAGRLVLYAVLLVILWPFAAALLRAIPGPAILAGLAIVSIGAFLVLESRRAHVARTPPRGFVNYRGSGKVPVHEEELLHGGLGEEDPEGGAEPHELL